MARIVGNIAVIPRIAKRIQNLSGVNKIKTNTIRNDVYDAELIQRRLDIAKEAKAKLDAEIKEREDKLNRLRT